MLSRHSWANAALSRWTHRWSRFCSILVKKILIPLRCHLNPWMDSHPHWVELKPNKFYNSDYIHRCLNNSTSTLLQNKDSTGTTETMGQWAFSGNLSDVNKTATECWFRMDWYEFGSSLHKNRKKDKWTDPRIQLLNKVSELCFC